MIICLCVSREKLTSLTVTNFELVVFTLTHKHDRQIIVLDGLLITLFRCFVVLYKNLLEHDSLMQFAGGKLRNTKPMGYNITLQI